MLCCNSFRLGIVFLTLSCFALVVHSGAFPVDDQLELTDQEIETLRANGNELIIDRSTYYLLGMFFTKGMSLGFLLLKEIAGPMVRSIMNSVWKSLQIHFGCLSLNKHAACGRMLFLM